MSCGVGRRHGSDLWLGRRPAATGLIRPLAWEPPYAVGVALKGQKIYMINNIIILSYIILFYISYIILDEFSGTDPDLKITFSKRLFLATPSRESLLFSLLYVLS